MQLDGATELEQRLYDACLRVEQELPASELATAIVVCLSEAGTLLQQQRSRLEERAKLTEDQKGRLSKAIENCLTMFNTMSRVWPPEQNVSAARDSILSEIEHMLEFGGE